MVLAKNLSKDLEDIGNIWRQKKENSHKSYLSYQLSVSFGKNHDSNATLLVRESSLMGGQQMNQL